MEKKGTARRQQPLPAMSCRWPAADQQHVPGNAALEISLRSPVILQEIDDLDQSPALASSSSATSATRHTVFFHEHLGAALTDVKRNPPPPASRRSGGTGRTRRKRLPLAGSHDSTSAQPKVLSNTRIGRRTSTGDRQDPGSTLIPPRRLAPAHLATSGARSPYDPTPALRPRAPRPAPCAGVPPWGTRLDGSPSTSSSTNSTTAGGQRSSSRYSIDSFFHGLCSSKVELPEDQVNRRAALSPANGWPASGGQCQIGGAALTYGSTADHAADDRAATRGHERHCDRHVRLPMLLLGLDTAASPAITCVARRPSSARAFASVAVRTSPVAFAHPAARTLGRLRGGISAARLGRVCSGFFAFGTPRVRPCRPSALAWTSCRCRHRASRAASAVFQPRDRAPSSRAHRTRVCSFPRNGRSARRVGVTLAGGAARHAIELQVDERRISPYPARMEDDDLVDAVEEPGRSGRAARP